MSEKKLFIVDTISSFRMRYVIEANTISDAYDELVMRDSGNPDDEFTELTQKHLGEQIVDGREISKEEFNKLIEELGNDQEEISSYWLGEKAIRKVNYGS